MQAEELEATKGDPRAMEELYRQAEADGTAANFREALIQQLRKHATDVLTLAWAFRLDIPVPVTVDDVPTNRYWRSAVVLSIALGILFILLRGDKPPIPLPGASSSLFWLGWAPLTGVAVLVYLSTLAQERWRWYAVVAMVTVSVGLITAWLAWDRTDQIAVLVALHLPFITWAGLGMAVVWRHATPATQFYAYIVKSMEILMTAAIYLAAFVIFCGLTLGIFSVLGVTFTENTMLNALAWGIGAIPVLALASVYQADLPPAEQNWQMGLTRTLRILTLLMLPLALGVLAAYVFWFMPMNFSGAFEERNVLIVYNITIIAIIMLLCTTVSGEADDQQSVLYYAILTMAILTVVLNAYALTAIISRILQFGVTPNRHAVVGWNSVTLVMLLLIVVQLWRSRHREWVSVFREATARVMLLPVGWALWVLLGLPLVHLPAANSGF